MRESLFMLVLVLNSILLFIVKRIFIIWYLFNMLKDK